MLNDKKKLNLIKEALKSWRNGTLSNNSTLIAIGLVIDKQPPLSKAVIAKGKELERQINR